MLTAEATELAHELRRARLRKDIEAVVRGLTALAPACEYRSAVLARALGITSRQLQRMFVVSIGCAPQTWLNEQRLLVAQRMLRSALTVKEVAYALGFRSVAHLSRTFKKHFGVAPSVILHERSPAQLAELQQVAIGSPNADSELERVRRIVRE